MYRYSLFTRIIPLYIGMMDPAYFVGRRAIIDWINNTFQMNLAKIEETASGTFKVMNEFLGVESLDSQR